MMKVAAYCRVSTDKQDQANSFESQKRYFREYIECKPDWDLYEIYADEGLLGTSTKKRVAFNRMISDVLLIFNNSAVFANKEALCLILIAQWISTFHNSHNNKHN